MGGGDYKVTATGPNGCKSTGQAVFIEDTGVPSFQLSLTMDCSGNSVAILNVVGGTPPYTISSNIPGFPNIPPNTNFSVSVTGANGCSSTQNFATPAFTALTATSTSTPTIIGQATGTATANPSGGTPPYTYKWTGGKTTQTITDLIGGVYECTVTDANGCTKTTLVAVLSVSAADEPGFVESAVLSTNPTTGPANLLLVLKKTASMSVEILAADGRLVAQLPERQWVSGDLPIDLSGQPSGVYLLKINLDGVVLTRRLTVVR